MSFAFRCLFVALPALTEASSTFLHRSEPQQALTVAQDRAILAAIGSALNDEHRQATERRLAPIETSLAPTLAALSKNEYGRFGHMSVRLALHRLFVQRHAWFVKGIESDGNWSAAASPTSILQGNVPELVQSLFEERLGSHGLDAHEVAVMAATLEKLAHEEAMERLKMAYEVAKVPSSPANLTVEQADSLLDVYMAGYVANLDLSEFVNIGPAQLIAAAKEIYPAWGEVVDFVRKLRQEATSGRLSLTSADVSDIVTRIGDQYGRWQAWECRDLKRSLLAVEDDGTGRVSLSKFYDSALNQGQWQFTESPSYLRSLGALDESDPGNPRVIVANYILSPSNCVASSKYYSVCCIDECEDLVGHLEQEIRSPVAEPERIARLVAALASPTTPANRTLPAQLLRRLDDIAADNGGVVSLHGRLFAQWMHHAYPRECPFPHVSGTTKPLRADAYVESTGNEVTASAEEMSFHIEAPFRSLTDVGEGGGAAEDRIRWSSEDELYVERPTLLPETPEVSSLCAALRLSAFGITVFSVIAFLLRMDRAVAAEAGAANRAKFHV